MAEMWEYLKSTKKSEIKKIYIVLYAGIKTKSPRRNLENHPLNTLPCQTIKGTLNKHFGLATYYAKILSHRKLKKVFNLEHTQSHNFKICKLTSMKNRKRTKNFMWWLSNRDKKISMQFIKPIASRIAASLKITIKNFNQSGKFPDI